MKIAYHLQRNGKLRW